jgi:hypothetical protein
MRMRSVTTFAFVVFVVSCGAHRPREVASSTATRAWIYDVSLAPDGDALTIEARFDGAGGALGCDEETMPFVRDVVDAKTNAPIAPPWTVSCAKGCDVRYRFALREAAAALHDPEEVTGAASAWAATTTAWLLHPPIGDDDRGRVEIQLHEGASRFASAMKRIGRDRYAFSFDDLDLGTVTAFGDFHVKSSSVGGAQLDVVLLPQGLPLGDDVIAKWIEADASAIAKDLGRLPLERLMVVTMANDLAGPTRGVTLGGGGASLVVRVSKNADASKLLADDWVATHEMLHASMPMLPRQQVWLSEGIASYLEPFIRARVGMIPPEKVWRDLVEGMPQGLPEKGDEGLDVTHTWGRTYWGGALFCLLADIAIRDQTHGERSFDDVMRGANAAGGNVLQFWSVAHFVEVGDAATKTTVLHDLYTKMSHTPAPVDLAALWKKLGVEVGSDAVRFDDGAPMGKLRRSMTDPIR